jgi:hypothetical protein
MPMLLRQLISRLRIYTHNRLEDSSFARRSALLGKSVHTEYPE